MPNFLFCTEPLLIVILYLYEYILIILNYFLYNYFLLDDHVSHLVHAPEKVLNALLRLIFDFESINDEIEYLSKLPTSDGKRESLLNQCKNFIKNVSKLFTQGPIFEELSRDQGILCTKLLFGYQN